MSIKENIPDFLIEMSKQMREQEQICIKDPIWQVRYRKNVVTEEGYNQSHWIIIEIEDGSTLYDSEHDLNFNPLLSYLFDNSPDWVIEWAKNNKYTDIKQEDGEITVDCFETFSDTFNDKFVPDHEKLPDCVTKVYMQKIETVVKSCFTKNDAEAFIARKQHDYPELYIYVDNMTFCHQMIKLREWIVSLTKENDNC
ncbi:ead/Ea22-like family protein [Photobacterium kishitanii]|uniref:ead/Ea22-like family protein n=1 Tax=Photobacterium kishitanii TaxID=318456 RepID=UPI001EFEEEFD|nr:ead/Ea22-like family protein [Photobacterium kishitanii]